MTRICTRSNHCNLARKSRVKRACRDPSAIYRFEIRPPRIDSPRIEIEAFIGELETLFSSFRLTDTFGNLNRILRALGYTGPF